MNIKHWKRFLFLLTLLSLVGPGLANAKEICLVAESFSKTMPDGVMVPMWGYGEAEFDGMMMACDWAQGANEPMGTPPQLSSPGPVIEMEASDSTLTIHLLNLLAEPTSVIVPALGSQAAPAVGGRIQSLAAETAPSSEGSYSWTNVAPGTYLYHSATHPSVQVQMGLYGALTKNFADAVWDDMTMPPTLVTPAAGYDCPTCAYDSSVVLLYSEVDKSLHDAIDGGTYGTDTVDANGEVWKTTINYQPDYFLVNGAAYPSAPIAGLTAGEKVLLRFLNAGSQDHVPAVNGLMLEKIAQDGSLMPNSTVETSALLVAGSTADAFVTLPAAEANATYIVYDRILDLTNAGSPNGGMIVELEAGAGALPSSGPSAADGMFAGPEDVSVPGSLSSLVMSSSTGCCVYTPLSAPGSGSLTTFNSSTGAFTYEPGANFNGEVTFRYVASDDSGTSNVATVTINIGSAQDAPVAVADGPFYVLQGASVSGNVLGNDYDADGDTLTVASPPAGVNEDGTFTYTPTCSPEAPAVTCVEFFSYQAYDGTDSSTADVTFVVRGTDCGLNLSVVSSTGGSVDNFRWTLEEDLTYHGTPGVTDPNTLALGFHRSYMPVVATGNQGSCLPALEAGKHYFVSVLPDDGYAMGAAAIPPGASNIEVVVNPYPLPTAQITIFAFEDNQSVNGTPDLPEETGLEGFQVIIEDAAGRYGAAGGHTIMDAYANPLGTTYNPDGSVNQLGTGVILTDADGYASVQNLPPGKFGVLLVPPANDPGWVQTSTIEGQKVSDAWVKPNEPPFFAEFGPPGPHVFFGFVKATNTISGGSGGQTLSGNVVNLHTSRPPDVGFYAGGPFSHTIPWVGLNDLAAGGGNMVYAQRTEEDPDGNWHFQIPNVPEGNYQLVIWDEYLDLIIGFSGVTVEADGCNGAGDAAACNFGDIPLFQWFTRLENWVYNDENGNGEREDGEQGMREQNINIRWRDGTIYSAFPTDLDGFVPFDEVFPFFNWMVVEVDFARYDATGAKFYIDAGGEPGTGAASWGGILNPQIQPDTMLPYRVEPGTVLTQGMQGFIGQTSVIEWGKKNYETGQNGGISGIVFYATTRAEAEPRNAAAEEWEPGIPDVTVRLYDETGTVLLAETTTDSWDGDPPTGCVWDPADPFGGPGHDKCFDGLRVFNQLRPGVFDGGYAFGPEVDCPGDVCPDWVSLSTPGSEIGYMKPGKYVVEVVPPPGYELVKEEDVNVVFGNDFGPNESGLMVATMEAYLDGYYPWATGGLAVPACVGPLHQVPAYLALFPGAMESAPFALQDRPLCNRKLVTVADKANAAADFFLFTESPIASHVKGFILDDNSNEFDPNSPNFGEKYAPPWVPVAFRDWTGREITRVYSDEWGNYNALLPSTFTANLAQPSGMSPNMVTACMNDPGPIEIGGELVNDPFFKPQYSQFCYTLQYMPGTTTYLDTPVVPVAAFTGPDQFPLDCELPDNTPKISHVQGGPYVASVGATITIVSQGMVEVPNPAYCPGPPLVSSGICDGMIDTNKTIVRNYGFGAPGEVTLDGVPLMVNPADWSDGQISVTIMPADGVTSLGNGGQLEVTSGNGRSTVAGIHLTIGGGVDATVAAGGSIQQAIDDAARGDLILVECGKYEEMVVMWKPVRLQGFGAGCTRLNATNSPAEKLQALRLKLEELVGGGLVTLLPGQEVAPAGLLEPTTLFTEEGAGILVFGELNNQGNPRGGGRIDGFHITGSQNQAIIVNGNTQGFEITNNVVKSNSGIYGGGIRVGHPTLVDPDTEVDYVDARNNGIQILNNEISENGGTSEFGAGGGLALCTGADNYRISENWVCGNYTLGNGAGIGHLGLSDHGEISSNTVLFNQSFNQGGIGNGGGIAVEGQAPLGTETLSEGSGSVSIIGNVIQGNQSGAGDGAGIRIARVNGQDLPCTGNPNTCRNRNLNPFGQWYGVNVVNNMITNNVAGFAGGGISLQDAPKVYILHNTIAHNDSTATTAEAFPPGSLYLPGQTTSAINSNPQPAGIVSRSHSTALAALLSNTGANDDPPPWVSVDFSNPNLANSILWENRSFGFQIDTDGTTSLTGPSFWDLGVLPGSAGSMAPSGGVLTDITGYPGNTDADPLFVSDFFNGPRGSLNVIDATTGLQTAIAFDEGGNFIDVKFGPLTLSGNYHIADGSAALGIGTNVGVTNDIDLDSRDPVTPDAGADEFVAPAAAAPLTTTNEQNE